MSSSDRPALTAATVDAAVDPLNGYDVDVCGPRSCRAMVWIMVSFNAEKWGLKSPLPLFEQGTS